ncbi:MAG: hypothetical protein V1774_00645 [Candidatus Eisenbacteria bacterium]
MAGRDGEVVDPRFAPIPHPAKPKVLRTGTYLHTSCPACGAEIVDRDWIHFMVISATGATGELLLSARFNVFEQQATIPLGAGDEVRDVLCPHCRTSLLDPEQRCEYCGARAMRIRVSAVRTELELLLCSRYGCHWHAVPESDRQRLILENES